MKLKNANSNLEAQQIIETINQVFAYKPQLELF